MLNSIFETFMFYTTESCVVVVVKVEQQSLPLDCPMEKNVNKHLYFSKKCPHYVNYYIQYLRSHFGSINYYYYFYR